MTSADPAEFVEERGKGVAGADRLQPGQGLLCDADLDLIQHSLICLGQSLASQAPRWGSRSGGCAAECADCRDDGRPGRGNLPASCVLTTGRNTGADGNVNYGLAQGGSY
jgi:hypothetical protein